MSRLDIKLDLTSTSPGLACTFLKKIMSSVKSKKGPSKEELRRLMKRQKNEQTINHPFAKYNSLGNLICTICNCQIKSDKLWNPHLMSRSHKEAVAMAKEGKTNSNTVTLLNKTKRQINEINPEETESKRHKAEVKPKGILKNPIVTAAYSSDDESDNDSDKRDATPAGTSELPSDFFDSSVKSETSSIKTDQHADTKTKLSATESLPEGFFDDPKADAKARNVEYVKKEEVEWEKFQAEIKQVTDIAEQIEAEEDFVNTEERHLDEIDEQLAQWSRVNDIVQRKEQLMSSKSSTAAEEIDKQQSTNSDDDEDFSHVFGNSWRSKAL